MEKAIKVLNELQKQGLIKDYVISGGIAAIFYIEPVLTYDLDIFFVPAKEEKLINLAPIYNELKKRGYHFDKEHIMIGGVPVQFIPVYNELVKEAVANARETKYKGVKTRVLNPEYLAAIMLETFRPKDKERLIKFLEEAKIDQRHLKEILKKHHLIKKFEDFKKFYYEK